MLSVLSLIQYFLIITKNVFDFFQKHCVRNKCFPVYTAWKQNICFVSRSFAHPRNIIPLKPWIFLGFIYSNWNSLRWSFIYIRSSYMNHFIYITSKHHEQQCVLVCHALRGKNELVPRCQERILVHFKGCVTKFPTNIPSHLRLYRRPPFPAPPPKKKKTNKQTKKQTEQHAQAIPFITLFYWHYISVVLPAVTIIIYDLLWKSLIWTLIACVAKLSIFL